MSAQVENMLEKYPEYVVGEPVPEVEPRIDGEVLVATRQLTRWAFWFWVVYIGASAVMAFVPMGFGIRIGVTVLGVMVWSVPFWRHRKILKVRGEDQWCIPFWDELRYRLATTVAPLGLTFPLVADDGVSGLVWIVGINVSMFGVAFFVASIRGCAPGQLSCQGCSYCLVGLTIPCDCPECGVRIYSVAEMTDRPRVLVGGLGWLGGGLSVAGLAMVLILFLQPGLVYGQLPRGALLGVAATDKAAFAEAIALPMTQAERSALIDGLIAEDERNGMWSRYSYEQRDWLEQCLGDGSMSRGQLGRILAGYAEEGVIRIDAPGKARVGEEITVRLLGKRVQSPFRPRYYFRGYRIGDDPALYEGSAYPKSFFKVTKGGKKHYAGTSGYDSEPVYVLTPRESGEVVIRARVVLALIRGAQYNTLIEYNTLIDWDLPVEDAFEVGKEVLWYHVVELEHRIEVDP